MKQMRLSFVVLILILAFQIFAVQALATIGVGVGVGKIQVDEKLRPGVIYELPPFTVLNTGDEPSDYEVSIEYHEQQPELRPPSEWFIFSPKSFYLKPGEVQEVAVKLDLPLKMEPGDYFAYLEGHPTKTAQSGQARVGVAAAAKLYFTVSPASFLQGIYYKTISIWQVYAPLPQVILAVVILVVIIVLFKKFFSVNINLNRKNNKPKSKPELKSVSGITSSNAEDSDE